MIARHFGKHIPGNPVIIVANMPGAGSKIAGQFIYAVGPKDGTQIGAIFAGALIEPLIATRTAQYDASRFQECRMPGGAPVEARGPLWRLRAGPVQRRRVGDRRAPAAFRSHRDGKCNGWLSLGCAELLLNGRSEDHKTYEDGGGCQK